MADAYWYILARVLAGQIMPELLPLFAYRIRLFVREVIFFTYAIFPNPLSFSPSGRFAKNIKGGKIRDAMKKINWLHNELILIDKLLLVVENKALFDTLMARAQKIYPLYRHPLERFLSQLPFSQGEKTGRQASPKRPAFAGNNGKMTFNGRDSHRYGCDTVIPFNQENSLDLISGKVASVDGFALYQSGLVKDMWTYHYGIMRSVWNSMEMSVVGWLVS